MSALMRPFHRTIAAAAGLTGRRFGLLVASSVVATSAIVASAMTNPNGPVGPLAALIGRSMASDNTPVETSPSPGPSQPTAGSSGSAHPSGGGQTAASTGRPSAPPVPNLSPEASGLEIEPEEEPEPLAPTEPQPEAGRVKHVFVISLASPSYEASFGAASQMPYLSGTLRPEGELLSKYSLLTETALPNGIAAASGQPPTATTKENCPKFECLLSVETPTLADQLGIGHFTWRSYVDGMVDTTGQPQNCVYPNPGEPAALAPGGYAAWENPFIYFHSLLDSGECSTNDVPLEELQAGLEKAASTPNYSYIAPDPCDAGVAGQCPEGSPQGAAAADAFLAEWVPQIVKSAAFKKDGLLVITFNEASAANIAAAAGTATVPSANTAIPARRVGALLISPFTAPGSSDGAPYNPYGLLRSFEDLFDLEYLGKAGGAKVKSFAPPLLGEGSGD
jgi:Phosphoesterase family